MFSLSWFTSIPGILITVGVLLLIVALIIFIVTSQKNKKKGQDSEKNNTSLQAVDQSLAAPSPTITPMPIDNGIQQVNTVDQSVPIQSIAQTTPITNNMPSPYSGPIVDNTSNGPMNTTMPIMDNSSIYTPSSNISTISEQPYNQANISSDVSISSPVMPPIAPPTQDIVSNPISMEVSTEPMMNSTPTIPQVEVPVVQPVDNIASVENLNINANENVANVSISDNAQINMVQPLSVPTIPSTVPDTPVVNEVSSSAIPVVEPISSPSPVIMPEVSSPIDNINNNMNPVQQESTSITDHSTPIYGGASPIVPDISAMQNTPQIYGGANPLENTQSVPISQIAGDINQSSNSSTINNNMVDQSPVQTASVSETITFPQSEVNMQNLSAQNNIQQTPVISVPQVPNGVDQVGSSLPIQDNIGGTNVNSGAVYQSIVSPQPSVPINTNVQ